MPSSLNPVDGYVSVTCDLTGGATVEFDIPDTSLNDTPEDNPVQFWLDVIPTATETDPD